jgi:diadenosine tetraphosphate (Ap4A) HIT family hydrolase
VTIESVEILSRVPALPGTLLKIPKRETVTDFETCNAGAIFALRYLTQIPD